MMITIIMTDVSQAATKPSRPTDMHDCSRLAWMAVVAAHSVDFEMIAWLTAEAYILDTLVVFLLG